jgi:four helix bundle protein
MNNNEEKNSSLKKKFNLNGRLVSFATNMVFISESLPKSPAGNHLSGQLARSGTAPALQYAEAQAAESPKDFIHKMKVALKELRETFNCLKIIEQLKWLKPLKLSEVLIENNELISIFVSSIKTAEGNNRKKF